MILNMHIRKDFDKWIETPKKRVTTLCGKITATKFAGIPGISRGQGAYVSPDGKDVGWCLKCCVTFLSEYDNNDFMWERKRSNLWLYNLYNEMIDQCGDQLAMHYKAAQDRAPTSLK